MVLPVTVDALVPWSDVRPTRRDLMALTGIELENAADMAACFPELWPTYEARLPRSMARGRGQTAIIGTSIIAKCPRPLRW